MRLALGVEYFGANFRGWQSQINGVAVQDVLEQALSRIAGHRVGSLCAGRTDAGVHATGQVVHFDTEAIRPLSAWVRGVNSHLPAGVSVRWAHPVDDAFHARFSARGRRYRYLLMNRAQRPGLWAGRVGWCHWDLDAKKMQLAAAYLLGEHDFSSFRAAECQAKSPIKLMSQAEVRSCGSLIVFDFAASAFLHHMVRNLVGALVYVGNGRQEADWIKALLTLRDRRLAAPTFAPDGLYFRGPVYETHWGLPQTDDDLIDGVLA